MTLEVRSTLKDSPIRAVIFGADGVGKSTFCAAAPRAVFIPLESGLDNIDALAVPVPVSWLELIAAIDELSDYEKCGTIVIDPLDRAEELCWALVCHEGDSKGKKRRIEDFGFQAGYKNAINHWRQFLAACDRAREKGKNILLIAHSHRKSVKNPTGEDYEQWQIKLHDKAAGLIREWSDVVGFAELDVATVDDGGRTKGQSTGRRILRAQPSAGYQSKTRYALPAKVPLDWPSFAAAVKAGSHAAVPELRTEFETRLAKLDKPDVTLAARDFLYMRGETVASLREAIATVQGYLDEMVDEVVKP